MARYGPGHKSAVRQKILRSAGEAFREHGYSGISVDDLMHRAGLSRGGFYGHFESKEALFVEMMISAMDDHSALLFGGLNEHDPETWLRGAVERYLNPVHRDGVAHGCPMAPLLSELTRLGPAARESFAAQFERYLAQATSHIAPASDLSARERGLAVFALLLGSLILSRATEGSELSDGFLEAGKKMALLNSNVPRQGKGEGDTG